MYFCKCVCTVRACICDAKEVLISLFLPETLEIGHIYFSILWQSAALTLSKTADVVQNNKATEGGFNCVSA